MSACGYNKLRYSVIGAYCSTGAVRLACIAHFPSTTSSSVAHVVKGVCAGIVWRGAPRPAIQVGSYPRAKFRLCAWTTMRFRCPGATLSSCRTSSRRCSGGWGRFCIVSSIRADVASDGRLLYEIGRSSFCVFGRLCVPSLGRPIIAARNVIYVDVRAVWRVSRVVSGIRADTVSDERPHVYRLR
jgi:hypothetical protein